MALDNEDLKVWVERVPLIPGLSLTEDAVHVFHHPTGLEAMSSREHSQLANKAAALRELEEAVEQYDGHGGLWFEIYNGSTASGKEHRSGVRVTDLCMGKVAESAETSSLMVNRQLALKYLRET